MPLSILELQQHIASAQATAAGYGLFTHFTRSSTQNRAALNHDGKVLAVSVPFVHTFFQPNGGLMASVNELPGQALTIWMLNVLEAFQEKFIHPQASSGFRESYFSQMNAAISVYIVLSVLQFLLCIVRILKANDEQPNRNNNTPTPTR